jgi:Ca2+:H+ antiporter
MTRPRLEWLLVMVPASIGVAVALPDQDLLIFATAALAILPLAALIGRSTEQLALHAGPRVGGLLNATFGNVTELVISIFLVLRGEIEIVKSSLIGSILGNLLLVLGMSFLAGGIRHKEQRFSAHAASVHASSMALAVAGLVMPALFVLSSGSDTFVEREVVSATVAGVLIVLYCCVLLFTLVTHVDLFAGAPTNERPRWSLRAAAAALLASTILVAIESELLVGALEPAVNALGLSRIFVGLILIPVIGNAAEHSTAVMFAVRDHVDVTIEIATGSSTQIALFVAPAIVFISLLAGHPMNFVFETFEVVAVATASILVAMVSRDGVSNWLEGAQLLATYAIIAISFFFVSGAAPKPH